MQSQQIYVSSGKERLLSCLRFKVNHVLRLFTFLCNKRGFKIANQDPSFFATNRQIQYEPLIQREINTSNCAANQAVFL